MLKKIKVFKFGGAALENGQQINRVINLLKQHTAEHVLVVVSAIGKTTDELERIVDAHAKGDLELALNMMESVKSAHYEIIQQLAGADEELFAAINDTFVEIEWALEEDPYDNSDYLYDQIVSVGELAASRLVAGLLDQARVRTVWFDARDVILTDNQYKAGEVQWKETRSRADEYLVPLFAGEPIFITTQGFIGTTTENFTTTLGRDASDYSAAIMAHCLDAESITVWKNVPGVFTEDPHAVENPTKIDFLTYEEAIAMIDVNHKSVLHPKTIHPLQEKNIPLFVRSFIELEDAGTRIAKAVDALG